MLVHLVLTRAAASLEEYFQLTGVSVDDGLVNLSTDEVEDFHMQRCSMDQQHSNDIKTVFIAH